MIVVRSPCLDRACKKLPEEVRDQFRRKLRHFVDFRFTHPSLRVKRAQGTADIWEASIALNHHFTFQKIEGGIRRRVIGPHVVLANP